MNKEHKNLLRQSEDEPNPKSTFWNSEPSHLRVYQLIKVNKDGYMEIEDKKYYE